MSHVLSQKIERNPTEEDVIGMGDAALGKCLESGDLSLVAETLRTYRSLDRSSGVGTAKLIHGVNFHWKEFEHEKGDNLLAWAVRETGHDASTIRKRLCEWEFLTGDYVPKPYRRHIQEYTVRQLDKIFGICVTSRENKEVGNLDIVQEDYQITDEHWLRLSEAVDEVMVSDVVREIKDKEKKSNHMSLKIDDNGDLWVYQGKTERVVGHLNTIDQNEVVQKAIRRITENSGITPRNQY